MNNLLNIIKDSNYSFSLFDQSLVAELEQNIKIKDTKISVDKIVLVGGITRMLLVIDHDLHNHDGELPDGIAEKFIEWAKSENLSFWK